MPLSFRRRQGTRLSFRRRQGTRLSFRGRRLAEESRSVLVA
jgi:hypothetical protein